MGHNKAGENRRKRLRRFAKHRRRFYYWTKHIRFNFVSSITQIFLLESGQEYFYQLDGKELKVELPNPMPILDAIEFVDDFLTAYPDKIKNNDTFIR